jgi:hypothetical protein
MTNMFPTTNRVFFTFPHAEKVFWYLEKDLFNVHFPMPKNFLVPRARHVLSWENEKSLLPEARKLFRHGQEQASDRAIC